MTNYLNYIPTEAPQGSGSMPNSANNLQSMISALQGGGMRPKQNNPWQSFGNSFGSQGGDNAMSSTPNPFASGGIFSPNDAYINDQGDLMSAGQVTPG